MKCTIPEISWHNRDPVLSVDIQPSENEEFYRLASGGYDCHILMWYLKIQQNGAVNQEMVSDLSRHQKAVNVVRWSPSGQYLASGDDDANIIIWTLKTDNIPLLEGETSDKETWLVHKVLRGHKEDVYDICWSPNGMKLISGSIDNTAILWDFTKGSNEHILSDHKGFVQGVTWDPKGQYIATLSSDRTCRIFDNSGKRVVARTHKGLLPLPESHVLYNKEVKYFHDDTFKSYFRRLNFSPDGNLLIAPSGCVEYEEFKAVRHTTLVFTLDCLTQPAAILPSPKQVTIAVRCCPLLFELRSDGTSPMITLPYRMVIAVATDTDVILYDTQQQAPFAHFQKIHYTRITDLTWSPDGFLLIASSTDGYCTMVAFEPGELGVQYVKEESEAEESILDISGCEEIDKNNSISLKSKEKDQVDAKLKKPNILEKWTVRKPKIDVIEENKKDNSNIKPPLTNEEPMDVDRKTPELKKNEPSKLVPKRIAPIRIGEVQHKKKVNDTYVEKIQKVQDNVIIENKEIVDLTDDNFVNNPDIKQNKLTPSKVNKEENQQSNTPPSKKRKTDNKKNHKNITNSPLLRFFQPIKSGNEKSTLNKSVSKHSMSNEAIEISDDECSREKSDNEIITKMKKANGITKILKVHVERCSIVKKSKNTISLSDDNSNKNESTINQHDNQKLLESKIKDVQISKSHSVKTKENDTEDLKTTNPICNKDNIDQTCPYPGTSKDNKTLETDTTKNSSIESKTKTEIVLCESENKENLEMTPINTNENIEKVSAHLTDAEPKENPQKQNTVSDSLCMGKPKQDDVEIKGENLNADNANVIQDIESGKVCPNLNNTEKMETEEVNSIINEPDSSKNTQPSNIGASIFDLNTVKPKVPRRVALITLSSPKRKKKQTTE